MKSSGIQKIKYGELHQFYPLKFEGKRSFEELFKLIQKSKVLFTDKYRNKIMDSLGYSLSKMVEEMQEEMKNSGMTIKMSGFTRTDKIRPVPSVLNSDDIVLELEEKDTSFKMNFFHKELVELEQQIECLFYEQKESSKIYGKRFVEVQERFVLLPFKVELSNGEIVWLNAILYIFANGMGVLKLEMPLINIGIEAFKENDIDSMILKVINKWGNKNCVSEPTLYNIACTYLKSIAEDTGEDVHIYGGEINYISLIDFDGMPKQINNISHEVQEDLYCIIAAPVPHRNNISFLKNAQEYIQKNSFGRYNINYIVKEMGGCLSYIDRTLLETILKENEIENRDDMSYFNLCNRIALEIFVNVEFALLIIILKKLNDCNCYYEKIGEKNDLSKIQKEYNQNILFISELQEECYGSVSDQTKFFEERMCHYLKQDIMDKKLAAIDNILKDEEKKKGEAFQNFLSVGGFVLTLLFGLPALYDTIVIVRNVFAFFPYNVPILTLENFSLFLWIVLNGCILLSMTRKIRIR